MYVVATAGHVDHGKSSLVQRLTGQDPDRLVEEKRRGLSIRLGYCWTRLEELPGIGDVAFVDVPGHERFIDTTLAGLGPAPVVLFVVAADDPWMPQAAEHLAALDALGVDQGLLVVTRSDLADPGPATARARHELASTSLAGIETVAVSSRTGAGFDELRASLAIALRRLPTPDPGADVRLWLDRQFHVRGAGTVVTGTLSAGTVRVGDQLMLDAQPVRVRGVECLQQRVQTVHGTARVALSLTGKVSQDGHRAGVLVTPGAFGDATVIDARTTSSDDVPERPILHVGATSLSVHARPLGRHHLRLTLDRPLPLRIGDRLILRDPGNRRLWGVSVLDADPAPLDRRGAGTARRHALERLDGSWGAQLAMRGVAARSRLNRLGLGPDELPPGALAVADWLVDPAFVGETRVRLEAAVRESDDGLTPAQAAQRLGLPAPELAVALAPDSLRHPSGRLRIVDGTGALGARPVSPAVVALREDLARAPYAAPDADRLAELGLDDPALVRLHREGTLLRLAAKVVLLPGADRAAAGRLAELDQPFTTSAARQQLGTSRRVVLPLLTHLDKVGLTVRLADDRRRIRVGSSQAGDVGTRWTAPGRHES